MTLEPWVLRTALVIFAVNGVNALLWWKLRSLERQGERAAVADATTVGDGRGGAKAA
jgi:hypothetical protein